MLNNKSILIIGGEGYIGNVVCNNLILAGYAVSSFDKLIYKNNLCVLNKIHQKNYRFIYGDMLDSDRIKPLIEKADVVVLLAGLVGDPITKKYQKVLNNNNIEIAGVEFLQNKKGEFFTYDINTNTNYNSIAEGLSRKNGMKTIAKFLKKELDMLN